MKERLLILISAFLFSSVAFAGTEIVCPMIKCAPIATAQIACLVPPPGGVAPDLCRVCKVLPPIYDSTTGCQTGCGKVTCPVQDPPPPIGGPVPVTPPIKASE